jgi:hypothetical protein
MGDMSLQGRLTAASIREQYIAVLKITLIELADALCRLAEDEGLPQPFRIRFKGAHLIKPFRESFALTTAQLLSAEGL